jgi:SAM-dependent methyltransferase
MKAGVKSMPSVLRGGRDPGKEDVMVDQPRRDFEASYRSGDAPWDIGGPQAEVVRLAEAGLITGSVLDIGCGTGENALYLAARGHAVFGLDGSATAIELARQKAAARGLPVQFHAWDALELHRLRKSFETVIDVGLFHVLADEERRRYAESLAEVTAPGSDLFILCFSTEEPPGPGPRRIDESEIRDAFRSLFATMDVQPAGFERRGRPPARALLARLTRI